MNYFYFVGLPIVVAVLWLVGWTAAGRERERRRASQRRHAESVLEAHAPSPSTATDESAPSSVVGQGAKLSEPFTMELSGRKQWTSVGTVRPVLLISLEMGQGTRSAAIIESHRDAMRLRAVRAEAGTYDREAFEQALRSIESSTTRSKA